MLQDKTLGATGRTRVVTSSSPSFLNWLICGNKQAPGRLLCCQCWPPPTLPALCSPGPQHPHTPEQTAHGRGRVCTAVGRTELRVQGPQVAPRPWDPAQGKKLYNFNFDILQGEKSNFPGSYHRRKCMPRCRWVSVAGTHSYWGMTAAGKAHSATCYKVMLQLKIDRKNIFPELYFKRKNYQFCVRIK